MGAVRCAHAVMGEPPTPFEFVGYLESTGIIPVAGLVQVKKCRGSAMSMPGSGSMRADTQVVPTVGLAWIPRPGRLLQGNTPFSTDTTFAAPDGKS